MIGTVMSIFRQILDQTSLAGKPKLILPGFSPGILGAFASLACAICAIYYVVNEYKSGARSWQMWVGGLLGGVVAAFWLFMFVGEFLFPH
jgi:drug/metabolite transporter (DMT)-like permease